MNADERLDRIVRDALTWEADRAARTQPTLDAAARKLASVLPPDPSLDRPRVTALPGSRGMEPRALMLVVVALMLALLAALVVIGSSRPSEPIHTSERPLYSLVLPNERWRIIKRPGVWEPGASSTRTARASTTRRSWGPTAPRSRTSTCTSAANRSRT